MIPIMPTRPEIALYNANMKGFYWLKRGGSLFLSFWPDNQKTSWSYNGFIKAQGYRYIKPWTNSCLSNTLVVDTDILWKAWITNSGKMGMQLSTLPTSFGKLYEFPTVSTTLLLLLFFNLIASLICLILYIRIGHFYFGKNRTFLLWLDTNTLRPLTFGQACAIIPIVYRQ